MRLSDRCLCLVAVVGLISLILCLRAVGDPARRGAVQQGKTMSLSSSQKSSVLDRLHNKHRPIIVFGPQADEPRTLRQRHAWVGALPEAGIKDRDIVVVEVLGGGESRAEGKTLTETEIKELREAFAVPEDGFAVVLVGRDGGEKARWSDPVSAQEIFGKIDAMPMRQQEVQAKGGGSE